MTGWYGRAKSNIVKPYFGDIGGNAEKPLGYGKRGRFLIFGESRDRLAGRNGMDFKQIYVADEMSIIPIAVRPTRYGARIFFNSIA
ncbi:MAG: hypothetical protein AB2L18_12625 [Anaerolineaceae bacterium]